MNGKIAAGMEDCMEHRHELARLFQGSSPLLAALGDETRQQIVRALLEADEVGLRVGQITEATHLSRPAVSHHLKVLKDAGAITLIKRGTMNFYFMDATSPAWKSFWELGDAMRALITHAKAKGYPDVYKEIQLL